VGTCPECGTEIRAGVSWCMLCYRDLASGSAAESTDGAHDTPDGVAHSATPPDPEDKPRWPCGRCHADNDYSDSTCAICGAPFLSSAGESAALSLPLVGEVTQLSTLARYALALGVALLVVVVVAAVGVLL